MNTENVKHITGDLNTATVLITQLFENEPVVGTIAIDHKLLKTYTAADETKENPDMMGLRERSLLSE